MQDQLSRFKGLLRLCCVAAALAGCTINPVTGARQLAIVSADQEISIGQSQYAPSRQMQGGDYVMDPALQRYVAGVGNRLAAVSDRDLPYEFAVINSSVPNAWALPGGKIAINRGLLIELESEAELAAVLGHEVVHAAARHGALAMQRGMLLQGALLAATIGAQRGNYSDLAVGAASVGAQLINQRNSREAELESDEYGMLYMSRAGYDPAAAINLQETFLRLSSERGETGWLAGLFASHPPSSERVAQNRATVTRLASGGEIGRDRYQAATRSLRESQPAYDAYDNAREAMANGRLSEANTLARDAARRYPAEGHFHSLLGDIALAEQRQADATGHYRDAIARNNAFFYYPLRLGLTLRDLNDLAGAETQLENSLRLLPTADAHHGLGQIAERRGDQARALEHYQAAAGSSSPSGLAAQSAIIRLELPNNPGRFLGLQTGRDIQGQLLVEVSNPTPQTVGNVSLSIRYVDSVGAIQTTGLQLTQALPPGSSQRLATGLGPFTSDASYEVSFVSASIIEQ